MLAEKWDWKEKTHSVSKHRQQALVAVILNHFRLLYYTGTLSNRLFSIKFKDFQGFQVSAQFKDFFQGRKESIIQDMTFFTRRYPSPRGPLSIGVLMATNQVGSLYLAAQASSLLRIPRKMSLYRKRLSIRHICDHIFLDQESVIKIVVQ